MSRFYSAALAALMIVIRTGAALAGEWSRNDVLKYAAGRAEGYSRMLDHENVTVGEFDLRASVATNAWIITRPVFVGENHILAGAFLNLDDAVTDPSSFAVLSVRDSTSDRVIREQIFTNSGRMGLENVFQKNVYLRLELFGTNVSVLSYGLVRQPEVIMTEDDLRISPAVLFDRENILRIHFTLRHPAVLDVILFDRSGRIVETLVKEDFFPEGDNFLYWEPPAVGARHLASGSHLIYFRARSTDGKTVELTRRFIFVKN